MIRNILYSLFLHFVLITPIYFGLNFSNPIEIKKPTKVAVSFLPKPVQPPINEVKPKAQTIPDIPKELPKELPKKSPPKIEKKKKVKKKIAKKKVVKKKKKVVKKTKKKIAKEKVKKKVKKPPIKQPKQDKKILGKIKKNKKEPEKIPSKKEPQYSFEKNTIEKMNLLARERLNIKTQIKRCYQRALVKMNLEESEEVVNMHIFVAKDGSIDLDLIVIKDFEKYENPQEKDFKLAVDAAKKALKFCSPIRNLPADKYDVWKEIDLEFGGKS